MASNLTLMIKEGGELTHTNLGSIWHAQTPDCILVGCGVSVASNVAYMDPGYILACGRIIRADSSSWEIPTSGDGASLVLSIDSESLDVSTFNTATPSITQDDINNGGTTYQVKLATFSIQNGVAALESVMPTLVQSPGILYGTAPAPEGTNYPNGTIYVQYN